MSDERKKAVLAKLDELSAAMEYLESLDLGDIEGELGVVVLANMLRKVQTDEREACASFIESAKPELEEIGDGIFIVDVVDLAETRRLWAAAIRARGGDNDH